MYKKDLMRNFKQFKCQLQRKRGFKVPVICPYWSSKHDPRWTLIQDRWHSKGIITKSLYIFNTNKLSRYVVPTLPILYNHNCRFICCGLGSKGLWLPTLDVVSGTLERSELESGVSWCECLSFAQSVGQGRGGCLHLFLSWWHALQRKEGRGEILNMGIARLAHHRHFYFLATLINFSLISC